MTSKLPAAIAGGDLEELKRYHEQIGDLIDRMDVDRSSIDRISRHVRRHLPLYAIAALYALVIVLIPTVNDSDGEATTAGSITEGDTGGNGFGDTSTGTDKGTKAAGATNTRNTPGAVTGGDTDVPVAEVQTGTGITRGGFECKAGVRQIPWSGYANPCVAKFAGGNGGKTYRGVDEDSIKIVIRKPAVDNGDITDAQNRAQGRADRAQGIALFKKYTSYLEKTMELYGRKIEFVDFQSRSSNAVEEAQSRGEEGACADATAIAETHQAFAVVGYNPSLIESQPFSQCASEKGLFIPYGASYFPEKYFASWHPYVWHVYMQCEQIGHDVAEYMGKRLHNRNAVWAKDTLYQKQKRVFGTYVPDNDGYQMCVDISEKDFKNKYGGEIEHRFDYQLDVTRFADQAEAAVVQFKAAGVTTLINACDTLSTRFLTEAADRQQWGPEWYIIGVALQDTDGAARTFKGSIIDGHLFGMSQLGKTHLIEGKDGEAFRTWKTAFPSDPMPAGYGDAFFRALGVFMMLQAAGPVLTPQNIAKGLQNMPPGGGSNGAFGTWSFNTDHTAIDDSREIYWMRSATGFDKNPGSYVETYGGKRFRSGEWPREAPPVYPKK